MHTTREPRFDLALPVRLGPRKPLSSGTTRNVSRSGMCVRSGTAFPENSTLFVELDGVRVRGSVRWVRGVADAADQPPVYDHGVVIISEGPEYPAFLEQRLGRGLERRAFHREVVDLRVSWLEPRLALASRARNIGRTGLFIANAGTFAVGQRVAFRLFLPTRSAPLALEGRVAHVQPAGGPRPGEAREGIGVALDELSADQAGQLADFLRTLEFEL
jgi:hypothetical protein